MCGISPAAGADTHCPSPPGLSLQFGVGGLNRDEVKRWCDCAKDGNVGAMRAMLAANPSLLHARGTGVGHGAGTALPLRVACAISSHRRYLFPFDRLSRRRRRRARASRPDPEFSLTPDRFESIQDDTTNVPDAKTAAHIETNAAKEGAYARATQGLFCWFFI